jgi:hypothetical protein
VSEKKNIAVECGGLSENIFVRYKRNALVMSWGYVLVCCGDGEKMQIKIHKQQTSAIKARKRDD